ncbi:GNAT family N-acetyltransferase [Paraburkholderia phymatum]|uniref:GCN5-related N-acetyltransferase n=1 Tax=Paraburkholderia phymatum (strain DSM 17167 / CIP 108236 / LMG 21445 / STM815) TaxID=391038 RepID=B2JRZ6_PARP8|nr:GNAT family N-acetyltransferase [Paraburkholderia phymatum]ACC73915.1 GCN5-related N-acetyltransferase [Paraburkholderia phymatum STM815]
MSMPEIHYRNAVPEDVASIRVVEYEAAQRFVSVGLTGIAAARPMDAPFVLKKVRASEVIVAQCDGVCVGFVMFAMLNARIYVEALDVVPQHAGRRIGAALLGQVDARARAAGATHVELSTFRHVPWNAPYYQRLGFSILEDGELDAALLRIRKLRVARGVDETKRVFMRRAVKPAGSNTGHE